MSIRKNTLDLDSHYDLTNSGQNAYLGTRTLFSWGNNNYGQLGQNNQTQFSSPIQIPGTTWSSINSGAQHSLAIKTDNTLWSWGLNQFGRLGQNNTTPRSSPVQIPGTSWSSLGKSASENATHTMAIKTDGTLWSWGSNSYGTLGQNNQIFYSSPVQIPGTTWSSIAAGYGNSLVLQQQ